MQEPQDSSITVVEPHLETYSDTNLNEKALGTQYIYTTEGQLIPADTVISTANMDLNQQHFNTFHVTEPHDIHIQQVDYQFHQQYPEGTVREVVPVTSTVFVHDQPNSFGVEQSFISESSEMSILTTGQESFTKEETTVEETTWKYSDITTNSNNIMASSEDPVVDNMQETSNSEEPAKADLSFEEKEQKQAADNQTVEVESNSVKHSPDIVESKQFKEELKEQLTAESVEESSNIESLKSNPAIEIQDEESVGETEDSIEEKQETIYVVQVGGDSEDIADEFDDEVSEEDAAGTSVENKAKIQRPRGRKPKNDIPLHILGHDVNKPMDDCLNGKTPKPRLGVKVPLRNLTSQIVSKDEIEEEIMARGKKLNELIKENSLVKQISTRLSQKLNDAATESGTKIVKKNDTEKRSSQKSDEESKEKTKGSIENNSDLLAILEGDGDADTEVVVSAAPQALDSGGNSESVKNMEREIALQQLQDLHYLPPKTKYVRKYKELTKDSASPKAGKLPTRSSTCAMELEPQVKVNPNLKTYSRKRKSNEIQESNACPVKKANIDANTEDIDVKPPATLTSGDSIYITKSSRIIKKKIIWDPDESPSRAKISPVKPQDGGVPAKTVVDVPKKSEKEKKVDDKQQVTLKKPPVTGDKRVVSPSKPVIKVKKGKSEVDRLLGDEGAINMLYDLKNSSDSPGGRRKTGFSVEKTLKDLAKKANQIKTDLANTTVQNTPKSLRKKDSTGMSPATPSPKAAAANPSAVSRQKSKDSSRSTPPPSFPYSNEVSYLIRRRSSSSMSSEDGDTGDSVEMDTSEEGAKRKSASASDDPLKSKKNKKSSENEKQQKRTETRIGHYKTFALKKTNKRITIDLNTDPETRCYFTSEVLSELTTALHKISIEKDCNAVLIRSANKEVFSAGVQYKSLVSDEESVRKAIANDLAEKIRNFLQCLMHFPKVLVAAVQGQCVGLAVTMLPLFDMVIACDDARFATPYTSLSCAPEAGFLLNVPYVSNYGLAGELLYAGQVLTADEAYRKGLVSKLCWPEKYEETIKTTLSSICQGSRQSLIATKRQSRCLMKQGIEEALETMAADLVAHWTSAECQSNFSAIE